MTEDQKRAECQGYARYKGNITSCFNKSFEKDEATDDHIARGTQKKKNKLSENFLQEVPRKKVIRKILQEVPQEK